MEIPFKPTPAQTPVFATARRVTKKVMAHHGWAYMLCWVMYADDSIGLHKFNRNGSHRRITT